MPSTTTGTGTGTSINGLADAGSASWRISLGGSAYGIPDRSTAIHLGDSLAEYS